MEHTEPGPAVVLITGVMAAGKSTVAELLARRLPRAAHVRGDLFRRMMEALDRVLRERTPRVGLWLDTSGQSPDQTVTAILEGLPAARVDTC
ncbi:hypothetical protein [Streptomyces laurentii]|uniref:hypothetical protein n=1 Tax=Streptomyces laurentii TaxID=39478 RepID=UPI0036D1E516